MPVARKDFYYAASRHPKGGNTCLVFKDSPFDPSILKTAGTVFLYGEDFQEDASFNQDQVGVAEMKYWMDHFDYAVHSVRPLTKNHSFVSVLADPSVHGPSFDYMKTIVVQGAGISMARRDGLADKDVFNALSSSDFQTYVELVQEKNDRAIDNLIAYEAAQPPIQP